VSHRVALCAAFDAQVEIVSDKQASGENSGDFGEVCTERNTAPNRPASACDLVAG